jgi:dTMP kinase
MSELLSLANEFRPPAFPGSYFISFEGIEGAGKSTQIIKAKEYLENQGHRVLVLREPGGTPFGEKLRQAILNSKNDIHPVAELHLFASSRAQLLEEVTLRELNTPGTVIIYDRYIDSTIAYQGKARGLGTKSILQTHSTFPLTLVPHKTFYLKIDPETSQSRQKMRNAPKDYFERKGLDFYKKLVEGYEEVTHLFPTRVVTIDADRSIDNVFHDIKIGLDQLISQSVGVHE